MRGIGVAVLAVVLLAWTAEASAQAHRVVVVVEGDDELRVGGVARSAFSTAGWDLVAPDEVRAARALIGAQASLDRAGIERLRAEMQVDGVLHVRVRAMDGQRAIAMLWVTASGATERFGTFALDALEAGTGELVRAAVELASAQTECTGGRVRNADTAGQCCFPDQVWSPSRGACIGAPRCPAGTTVSGETCVAGCPAGQEVTADTAGQCCWPGQAWSASQSRCVGLPTCPAGTVATGESCVAGVPPSAAVPPPAAVPGVAIASPGAAGVAVPHATDATTLFVRGDEGVERERLVIARSDGPSVECIDSCSIEVRAGEYTVSAPGFRLSRAQVVVPEGIRAARVSVSVGASNTDLVLPIVFGGLGVLGFAVAWPIVASLVGDPVANPAWVVPASSSAFLVGSVVMFIIYFASSPHAELQIMQSAAREPAALLRF